MCEVQCSAARCPALGDANAIYTSQRALRGHWTGEEVGLGAGSDKSGDDLTNLTAYFR